MKNTWILLLFPLFSACGKSTDHIKPIENFELEKYLGTWYEIARLDHPFERGLEEVTATYTDLGNGLIRVENKGVNDSGELSKASGKAKLKYPDKMIGQLKVSFFGPFYAPYKIFYLSDNYDLALVTSNSMNYLWVLSRTPKVDEDTFNALIEKCEAVGFNKGDFIFPSHS